MLFQKILISLVAYFIADNSDLAEADFSGKVVYVGGRFNAPASRLHHHKKLVHGLGRCSAQMLDSRFHVHHDDFVPGKDDMRHKGL